MNLGNHYDDSLFNIIDEIEHEQKVLEESMHNSGSGIQINHQL